MTRKGLFDKVICKQMQGNEKAKWTSEERMFQTQRTEDAKVLRQVHARPEE